MSEKMMADVEPHLRTEGEIRELQPRVDFMAQRMCQTQGMVLWALKEAGLTVVLLDPRAREIAPDGVSDQTSFVGRTKRVTPLTDAELNYSPEEWAEALAEDPSCIRAYLEAAEERGRRAGIEERDALLRALQNVRALAAMARVRKVPTMNVDEIDHLVRFCAEAGIVGSVLRDAALAPRDSGKDCADCESLDHWCPVHERDRK